MGRDFDVQEFLDLCEKVQSKNPLIVVEGKNDKKALKNLGFLDIITLATPLYKIIEIIGEREVVILTDFDSKGIELYKKIKSGCSQRGIKIDNSIRFYLRKSDLIHIEGLDSFISRLVTRK
jgi:5S rRNA maturation endonuclease (ribonuclease M5)